LARLLTHSEKSIWWPFVRDSINLPVPSSVIKRTMQA